MFPIKFRFPDYQVRSEEIIRESADALSVPEEAISSVIVASDSGQGYAEEIKQCRGHAGGNTHSIGGTGKTVPFLNEEGMVQSDVVYPSTTLTALFCYSHESPTYILSRYSVSHEFGHVLDYHARSALFPPPLFGNERSIEDYAPYYGAIILSEFAACFLTGRIVTCKCYEEIAENARASIEAALEHSSNYGNQLPWYILSQITQVGGTAIGMVGVTKPTTIRWNGIGEESERELARFTGELVELKAKYPTWDVTSSIELLTHRCASFAKAIRA